MARLAISIAHGLPPDAAQAEFRQTISEARTRFPGWIEKLDWTEDNQSVTVAGSGFILRCWCDERDLHVEGTIPLAWKLFENAIRSKIKRDIDRTLITYRR
jgi:Putative polyhydroxyalkanoic acid system protein (PHA_gran_rgn)